MAINAADVKKLRDVTGAGMMDCKKALTEADGDFKNAERILKEMGLAAVAKRQDRATENGRVFVKEGNGRVAMLSLSCETDFVAKNEDFVSLGYEIEDIILSKGLREINDELKAKVNDLIAIIKENMNIVGIKVIDIESGEKAFLYTHGDGAVAVCVVLSGNNLSSDAVEEVGHNLALHAAAYKPQFLSEKTVPSSYVDEQLSIFRKQVEGDEKLQGKPENVREGIVRGKLSKHYKEVCFLNQAYVKDDSKSVSDVLKELGKLIGSEITISKYSVITAGVNF